MPHLFLWKNRLRAHSSSVFPMKSHSFLFRSVNGAVAGIYTMHYPCCWFALSFGTWCASNRSWNQEENDWDAEKLQSPSLQGFPQFPQVFLLFSHSPTMFLSPLPAPSRFPKKYPPAKATWGRQKKVTVQLRNDAGEKGSLTWTVLFMGNIFDLWLNFWTKISWFSENSLK